MLYQMFLANILAGVVSNLATFIKPLKISINNL